VIGILVVSGTLLAAAPAQAQSAVPVRTVESVDLDRYAGEWFEIARYPNRFQRRCTGDVRATYARRPDGRIGVTNRCRTSEGEIMANGVAKIVDARTSARLKVRFAPAALSFLPFVWGDYWILGLAGDYSWAVVGSPDREYLWLLSRTPALDTAHVAAALEAARANGFDTARLTWTSHDPHGARLARR
jgi:apolipoprotein D and lipocalin family protein